MGTFTQLGDLILKSRGDSYSGKGKRTGVKGHYKYKYTDDSEREKKAVACGRCFPYANMRKDVDAAGAAGEHDDDRVVHGKIKGLNGPHGWVERADGTVMDWQTEQGIWYHERGLGKEEYMKTGWPKDEFYATFKPSEMRKYTTNAAMFNSFQSKNYGPWTKDEERKPPVSVSKSIAKGRDLPVGTIRTHGGVKKQKTAQGWVPVKGDKRAKRVRAKKKPTGKIVSKEDRDALLKKYGKLKVRGMPVAGVATELVDYNRKGDALHEGALFSWRDGSGSRQSAYSSEYAERNAGIKWKRQIELAPKFDKAKKIIEGIISDSGEPQRVRDAAAVLLIMAESGLRPGHGGQAHVRKHGTKGLMTLHAEDVTIDAKNGVVSFDFIGKKKQRNTASVTSPALATYMAQNTNTKKGKGLWKTTLSGSDLKGAMTDAGLGGFKPYDFRTRLGTMTAADYLAKYKSPPPLTEKNVKSIIKDAVKHTADRLNNTPPVAKSSYISPSVFEAWKGMIEVVKKAGKKSFAERIVEAALEIPMKISGPIDDQSELEEDLEILEEFPLPEWAVDGNMEKASPLLEQLAQDVILERITRDAAMKRLATPRQQQELLELITSRYPRWRGAMVNKFGKGTLAAVLFNELSSREALLKGDKSDMPNERKSPPKGYPKAKDKYADPENFKYPVDTADRTRAAISYFSQVDNYKLYTKAQQKTMWKRMLEAAKKFDINVDKKSGPPSVEGMVLEKAKGSFVELGRLIIKARPVLKKGDSRTRGQLQDLLDRWTERDPNTLAGRYYHDLKKVVNSIAKAGGEGSRGGKVIGHTASGKPIYEKHSHPVPTQREKYRDGDTEHNHPTLRGEGGHGRSYYSINKDRDGKYSVRFSHNGESSSVSGLESRDHAHAVMAHHAKETEGKKGYHDYENYNRRTRQPGKNSLYRYKVKETQKSLTLKNTLTKAKYTSKKKVGGKWVYKYGETDVSTRGSRKDFVAKIPLGKTLLNEFRALEHDTYDPDSSPPKKKSFIRDLTSGRWTKDSLEYALDPKGGAISNTLDMVELRLEDPSSNTGAENRKYRTIKRELLKFKTKAQNALEQVTESVTKAKYISKKKKKTGKGWDYKYKDDAKQGRMEPKKPASSQGSADDERRGNVAPKDSNWSGFADKLDIGEMDLDNIAYDMGYESFKQMDRSINPRNLSSPRKKGRQKKFLAAVREHSMKAEDMSDAEILELAGHGKPTPQKILSKFGEVAGYKKESDGTVTANLNVPRSEWETFAGKLKKEIPEAKLRHISSGSFKVTIPSKGVTMKSFTDLGDLILKAKHNQ